MSTGCKKSVAQGFYQLVCGNKYSGKVFICEDCKTPEIVFDKDDLLSINEVFEYVDGHDDLKEKELKAWDKVKQLLKEME